MIRRPSPLLLMAGLCVAVLALIPIFYLVYRGFGAGAAGLESLCRPAVWKVAVNSLTLAAITTSASILIGVPMAWLTVRSDLPFRRFWTVAAILPLAMPSYIMSYAVIALLGPVGVFSKWAGAVGFERWPDFIYGLPGSAFVITLINYPFIVLGVRAALMRMDPALEEAARGLGAGRRAIFLRVLLPQIQPSITAGGLLVALYTLSDFGTPALMRFNTFTHLVWVQYSNSFDRSAAAVTALLLAAVTAFLLWGEALVRGRAALHRSAPASQRPAPPLALGRWRIPALVFLSGMLVLALGMPLFTIASWIVVGVSNGHAVNLAARPVGNSLLAALLAATATAAAGLPVAFLAVRHRGLLTRGIECAAYAGNALPGIVIALAFVFFGSRVPWLYQTLPMLILAYVVRFLPQTAGTMRVGLMQLNPRLEEAARGLGRTRRQALWSVTIPLMLPGVVAGGALVFLTAIKELPITILLSPTGFHTLVTNVWSATQEGMFSQAAPPALLLVLISALSVVFILRREQRG